MTRWRSPAPAEAEFQRLVVEYAERRGWAVHHAVDGAHNVRMNPSGVGFPDLLLVRGEALMFAELKTDTGRASKAQLEWLERLERCGQHCEIWRPRGWDDIERWLR